MTSPGCRHRGAVYAIDRAALLEMWSAVRPSRDECARLTGISFASMVALMVATDSYRLAVKEIESPGGPD